MKIWKFPLPRNDQITLEMPTGTRILCLQNHGSWAALWGEVPEDSATTQYRVFRIFGTGWEFDDHDIGVRGYYVGTFQVEDFVWHLYEVIKE